MPSRLPNRVRRLPAKPLPFTPLYTSISGWPSSVAEIRMRFWRSVFSVLPISTHSSPAAGTTPPNSLLATFTPPVSAAVMSTQ